MYLFARQAGVLSAEPLACDEALRMTRSSTSALACIVVFLLPACLANTEIVNFGPLLCRADDVGLEELYAAQKLAADW